MFGHHLSKNQHFVDRYCSSSRTERGLTEKGERKRGGSEKVREQRKKESREEIGRRRRSIFHAFPYSLHICWFT